MAKSHEARALRTNEGDKSSIFEPLSEFRTPSSLTDISKSSGKTTLKNLG